MTEFTQEDLLRYVYGETSTQKSALIEDALKRDFNLRDSLAQIKSMQQVLDREKSTPSNAVKDRIMQYAASIQKKIHTH